MFKHSGITCRVVLSLAACLLWVSQAYANSYGTAPSVPGGEVKAEDGLLVVALIEPLLLLLLGSVLLLIASGIKLSLSRRVKILRNSILKN